MNRDIGIVSSQSIIDRISAPFFKLAIDTCDRQETERILSTFKQLTLVIGHGREDVIYFKNLSFCGRSLKNENVAPCSTDNCPYPQEKIPVQSIHSKFVIFLSCSALKCENGILPKTCSIAHSLFENRSVRGAMGPSELFTLSSDIVNLTIELVCSGHNLEEISATLSAFQEKYFNEKIDFLTLGEAQTPILEEKMLSLPRDFYNPREHSPHLEAQSKSTFFQYILSALHELEHFELLDSKGKATYRELRHSEPSIVNLIKFNLQIEAETLKKVVEKIEETNKQAVENMLAKSRNGYFWLSNHHKYLVTNSILSSCSLCKSKLREETLQHPLRSDISRKRLICSRCGIIKDESNKGPYADIGSIQVDRNKLGETNLKAKLTAVGFSPSINFAFSVNSIDRVFSCQLFDSSGKPLDSNSRVASGSSISFKVNLGALPAGVFFGKVFLSDMCSLTICSFPIPISM